MTDYAKSHLNNFNHYVNLADSLIEYHRHNDYRNMGLCIDKMNSIRSSFTYWSKHENPDLESQIENNYEGLKSLLISVGIPDKFSYRILFSEVGLVPRNGQIIREGYNSLNPFTTYNLSVDSEGYVVKTVGLNNKKFEIAFDFNSISSIKDLAGEYPFKNFDSMVIERIE